MTDILIQELFSGGDLMYRNGDLVPFAGPYDNMIYLALFGGDDWFMNDLIQGDASTKFTGTTERVCRQTTLNSSGRVVIENAVKADLQHLVDNIPGSVLTVSVVIVSDDRIQINITFNGQLYTYYFNTNETDTRIFNDTFSDEFA
jgi:hypothetical protein